MAESPGGEGVAEEPSISEYLKNKVDSMFLDSDGSLDAQSLGLALGAAVLVGAGAAGIGVSISRALNRRGQRKAEAAFVEEVTKPFKDLEARLESASPAERVQIIELAFSRLEEIYGESVEMILLSVSRSYIPELRTPYAENRVSEMALRKDISGLSIVAVYQIMDASRVCCREEILHYFEMHPRMIRRHLQSANFFDAPYQRERFRKKTVRGAEAYYQAVTGRSRGDFWRAVLREDSGQLPEGLRFVSPEDRELKEQLVMTVVEYVNNQGSDRFANGPLGLDIDLVNEGFETHIAPKIQEMHGIYQEAMHHGIHQEAKRFTEVPSTHNFVRLLRVVFADHEDPIQLMSMMSISSDPSYEVQRAIRRYLGPDYQLNISDEEAFQKLVGQVRDVVHLVRVHRAIQALNDSYGLNRTPLLVYLEELSTLNPYADHGEEEIMTDGEAYELSHFLEAEFQSALTRNLGGRDFIAFSDLLSEQDMHILSEGSAGDLARSTAIARASYFNKVLNGALRDLRTAVKEGGNDDLARAISTLCQVELVEVLGSLAGSYEDDFLPLIRRRLGDYSKLSEAVLAVLPPLDSPLVDEIERYARMNFSDLIFREMQAGFSDYLELCNGYFRIIAGVMYREANGEISIEDCLAQVLEAFAYRSPQYGTGVITFSEASQFSVNRSGLILLRNAARKALGERYESTAYKPMNSGSVFLSMPARRAARPLGR